MPNIGVLLKQEISRLSRRETRTQIETLKRASAQYRQSIAAMRKQIITLEREISRLSRQQAVGAGKAAAVESAAPRVRFSSKWLRPAREKLGLSAAEYGRLLGVTGQTVYNWERGASEPRDALLQRVAELRGIGKREAQARLDALKAGKPKRGGAEKAAAGKPKGKRAAAKAAAPGKAARARKATNAKPAGKSTAKAAGKSAAKPRRAASAKAAVRKQRSGSGKPPAAKKAKPARAPKTPAAKKPAAAAPAPEAKTEE